MRKTIILLFTITIFLSFSVSAFAGNSIADIITGSLNDSQNYTDSYANLRPSSQQIQPSLETDYPIPLDDLMEGVRRSLSALGIETVIKLETDVYPARLHIFHNTDEGKLVEYSAIELKNSAYDEGRIKNISGYDNLELFFPYPDGEDPDQSIYSYFWLSDCTAVLTGMERGSQNASSTELEEATKYVQKAITTDVEEGFNSELFEAGNIKYATVVSRPDGNERILKLQAGNTNVSFGVYATRDRIRKAAEGLSWGNDFDTSTPTVAPSFQYTESNVNDQDKSYVSQKYMNTDDLPSSCNTSDIDLLVKDWLAYPEYNDAFYATEPEVTIKTGEETRVSLFHAQNYEGGNIQYQWYGGGNVNMNWSDGGSGWVGHSWSAYFTATSPCTILVSATNENGITAHMVIYAEG